MTTGKTKALTRWTFVGKVTSRLFNKLSRLLITFLPIVPKIGFRAPANRSDLTPWGWEGTVTGREIGRVHLEAVFQERTSIDCVPLTQCYSWTNSNRVFNRQQLQRQVTQRAYICIHHSPMLLTGISEGGVHWISQTSLSPDSLMALAMERVTDVTAAGAVYSKCRQRGLRLFSSLKNIKLQTLRPKREGWVWEKEVGLDLKIWRVSMVKKKKKICWAFSSGKLTKLN